MRRVESVFRIKRGEGKEEGARRENEGRGTGKEGGKEGEGQSLLKNVFHHFQSIANSDTPTPMLLPHSLPIPKEIVTPPSGSPLPFPSSLDDDDDDDLICWQGQDGRESRCRVRSFVRSLPGSKQAGERAAERALESSEPPSFPPSLKHLSGDDCLITDVK